MHADGQDLRRDRLDPRSALASVVGLRRQMMSADLVTRTDGWERGVRSVLLQNDVISLEVVVDRAMDIAAARIRQVPVGWRSPTGIVAPWFVENTGFGPHRGFFGGLLTTCGLDHIGPPTVRSAARFNYEARAEDAFPMHGRISGTPAVLRGYGVGETADTLEAYVEGELAQVTVFGEHLVLARRISISYGSAVVTVRDTVRNEGYASSPLALMYHVNAGWPVVAPGARIEIPGRQVRGDLDYGRVRVPEAGTPERTSLHVADQRPEGRAWAAVLNDRIDRSTAAGLRVWWDPSALPTLVQWEIANAGGHCAVGLEPSTMRLTDDFDEPDFPVLEPGEMARLGVEIELLHAPSGSDLLNREDRAA
ncbi:aldose 1-epimerase family protein [Naasia sp. SYSU D00948]|uniref:aldose 1-epimerase family protein n=1 Tax=Naasia sp. SYSU D00948 TaxID=2817379 RepID=UPI001B318068|nr:aldose 1-epimerase family protein [Naasia sp. SYSU D00948]